jgi:hypothetical protein
MLWGLNMKSSVKGKWLFPERSGFSLFNNPLKMQQHDNTINHMQLPSLNFVKKVVLCTAADKYATM